MSETPERFQQAAIPGQFHCHHCGHNWFPHQAAPPKKCPNCQCKLWHTVHVPGFHRVRQPRLLPKVPVTPEGGPPNA